MSRVGNTHHLALSLWAWYGLPTETIMPPELQLLKEEVLSLPTSSRAWLANILLESLGSSEHGEEIERSWAREAEQRVRQIDTGVVELLDGEEVMREMRSICR